MNWKDSDFGVNFIGMADYIEDINAIVLTKVGFQLENTLGIENAVLSGWSGEAPEKFIKNIKKGAKNMAQELKELQKTFETQLKGIQSQIIDMDANLVEEE